MSLELNPLRLRDTVNSLWGYIHSADCHDCESGDCMEEVCARARAALDRCCDMHNSHCEPPSDLCCHACGEARHPEHAPGVVCVLTAAIREQLVSDMAGRLDMPDLTELPSGGGHYGEWIDPPKGS